MRSDGPRWRALPATATIAALVLAGACGGAKSGKGGSVTVTTGSGGGNARLEIRAHDIYYDPANITAPAGEIKLDLAEQGSQTHTLLIDGVDGFKLSVSSADRDDSGTIDLKPGAYTYYCDIPGHRSQGMEGTITLA